MHNEPNNLFFEYSICPLPNFRIFYSMCWSVAIDMFRFRCVVLCLCLKHNALFFLSCTIGRHQLYGCMWAGHDLTWLDKLGCQLLPAFQCYFHLQPISCRLQNQSDHSTHPKVERKYQTCVTRPCLSRSRPFSPFSSFPLKAFTDLCFDYRLWHLWRGSSAANWTSLIRSTRVPP